MGMFLNSSVPYEGYKEVLRDTYFVDKTLLLKELKPYFEKRNRYCCITRPRRFGKTVMANMVGRFSGKQMRKRGYLRGWRYPGRKSTTHISKDSLGYVYNLARKSEQVLQATIAGDTKTMEEILQFAHDTGGRSYLIAMKLNCPLL